MTPSECETLKKRFQIINNALIILEKAAKEDQKLSHEMTVAPAYKIALDSLHNQVRVMAPFINRIKIIGK